MLLMVSTAQRPGTKNMNGKYSVASGAKQDVDFNDDYTSKGHEYFDVWAPEIATHYGEVFWTSQGNQPLPPKIVERFAGKVMAITGYEQDQVMVNPVGHPGVNPGKDTSVPINWAYNHHYMAWMVGNYSEMVNVRADPEDVSAHGSPTKWIAVDKPNAKFRHDTSIPTNQMFSEGNGGESRRSFHGYPDGFAQLIESPQIWHITPMQIDTRNRDCGATPADINNCTRFTPGPEPLQARYGRGIPIGSNYSGVLECPCNSRYGGDPGYYPHAKTKINNHQYSATTVNSCEKDQGIMKDIACFSAAMALGFNATINKNSTVSDKSLPSGCFVVTENSGFATAYFNSITSSVNCSSSQVRSGQVTSAVGVTLGLQLQPDQGKNIYVHTPKGKYCNLNHQGVLKKFMMTKAGEDEAKKQLGQCESFCTPHTNCWGCSVDCPTSSKTICQWVAITQCGALNSWQGLINGDVSEKGTSGKVTMTVSGPADVWFGVGFDAVEMSDQPYTLIVNASGVIEQKIGTCGSEADHCPGDQLNSSVTVISNKVVNGIRTVLLTRQFKGATSKHYTFSLTKDSTMKFISAVGSTPIFAYHHAHAASIMTLSKNGEPTCICDSGANSKMCNNGGTTGCNEFVKNCDPAPFGDLVTQHNPTCNSGQYGGGLRCCGHKRIMLDMDQEIRPELLRYHMKFRFWFQEYKPQTKTMNASHHDLPRIYYQTEAHAGEYDIPPAFAVSGKPIPGYPNWPLNTPTPGTTCIGKCPDGPDCECIHTITYHWTVSNIRLIYAGGHCHAPSCISMELYRNDTGKPQLLCKQVPQYGTGNFPADKFDEAGYLALPPCLWGDDKGLEPSQFLGHNTPLFSIKKNRNTHTGHFGEMASWQMRGVNF